MPSNLFDPKVNYPFTCTLRRASAHIDVNIASKYQKLNCNLLFLLHTLFCSPTVGVLSEGISTPSCNSRLPLLCIEGRVDSSFCSMSVFRKPSLHVSPPDEPSFLPPTDKDQSWLSRQIKRVSSSSHNQNVIAPNDQLNVQDLGTRNASASSLASSAVPGAPEFQPPPTPRAPVALSSKNTPRSHRDSTTSS